MQWQLLSYIGAEYFVNEVSRIQTLFYHAIKGSQTFLIEFNSVYDFFKNREINWA